VNEYQADVIYTQNDLERVNFVDRILNKLNIELDKSNINLRLTQSLQKKPYDAVLIVKGNRIYPWLLKKIKISYPNILLVSFSGDNMSKWHNKSLLYHYGVSIYDLVLSINIPSYRKMERFCKAPVFYFDKAADEQIHRPLTPAIDEPKYDVLFIGSYEIERYRTLLFLADNNIKVHIFGSMWNKCKKKEISPNLVFHNYELLGEEYVKALSNAKIILGFLRKINEDTQTSRTFEIPACGRFMLIERTAEHTSLFSEGEEAEFFSSDKELLNKIKFYLEHDSKRELVARNGRKRILRSRYFFTDLVHKMASIMNQFSGKEQDFDK